MSRLAKLQGHSPAEYALLRQAIAHLVLGLGGEDDADTIARIAAYETATRPLTDAQLVEAIAAVLLTEAFNHKNLQPIDGRLANGMWLWRWPRTRGATRSTGQRRRTTRILIHG